MNSPVHKVRAATQQRPSPQATATALTTTNQLKPSLRLMKLFDAGGEPSSFDMEMKLLLFAHASSEQRHEAAVSEDPIPDLFKIH